MKLEPDFSAPDNKSGEVAPHPTDGSGANGAPEAETGHRPHQPASERRRRRRALISAPVRVRSVNATTDGPDETSTTLDVSRNGFLFVSTLATFCRGMEVAVVFPYSNSPVAMQAEQPGRVARVSELPDGRRAVAIALGAGEGQALVDAAGRDLTAVYPGAANAEGARNDGPLVMIVDADAEVRASLKGFLERHGYNALPVAGAREAQALLGRISPALLIAEIEGPELPGLSLCAYVKSTPRLQTVPVVLMTRSAYPSDYANAHSLGAVVCMAKPFRLERLGHVVRLLVPRKEASHSATPPRSCAPMHRSRANGREMGDSGFRLIR
jgi:CheY-like chemotaxis protein